jgi:hypothetical protein
MPRWLVGLLIPALLATSSALAEGSENAPKAVSCVAVETEARFKGFGFDHVVTLRNGCKKPARCSVKTDANPRASSVELAVGEERMIVTFAGSPAREFRADVTCREND